MAVNLDETRKIINDADEQMAELFVKRMHAVKAVAEYKKERGMQILDEGREQEVIRRNTQLVKDEELAPYYTEFLRNTMKVSRAYQYKLNEGTRVAFSGVPGAFGHIAASRLFPSGETIAYPNFKSAYLAVVEGECDHAVLPIENSSAGEVGQVTDLLFEGPLFINGTYELSVTHDLLTVKGAKLDEITTVVSHPQALAQCSEFIRKHGFKEVTYENTALAAKYVSELGDPHVAAIGAKESAEIYGLDMLMQGINTSDGNTTRFAILSLTENKDTAKTHGAHFALMFTVKNEAGALARALNIIGYHGFNLRALRSRPMKDLLWEYYFYAEAEGNIHSPDGESMIEEMHICCDRIKVLGSFMRQIPSKEEDII